MSWTSDLDEQSVGIYSFQKKANNAIPQSQARHHHNITGRSCSVSHKLLLCFPSYFIIRWSVDIFQTPKNGVNYECYINVIRSA